MCDDQMEGEFGKDLAPEVFAHLDEVCPRGEDGDE